MTKDTLSMRQICIILVLLIFSPSVRILPTYTANYAYQASWLTPIVAFLALSLLILALSSLVKKYPKEYSVIEILEKIFGKTVSKIIVLLYLIYFIFYLGSCIRCYGERITATIFSDIDISFFIIILVLISGYAIRKGVKAIARFSTIFLAGIIIVYLLLIIGIIPDIKTDYLLPVSLYDAIPVAKGSFGVMSVWTVVLPLLFLKKQITGFEKMRKYLVTTFAISTILTVSLIIMCNGLLSAVTISKVAYPFFLAIKNISLFNTIEKVESVVVVMWMASDLIMVAILTYIISNIIKELFKIKLSVPISDMILLLAVLISFLVSKNKFEIDALNELVKIPVSIVLTIILPIIAVVFDFVKRKVVKSV